MLGAFRASPICSGGLLWKVPYRLSATRKANLRQRLKQVDSVIAAVAESGVKCRSLETAMALPKESEMLPRGGLGKDTLTADKYTTFDRNARGYRKGVHKVPKWTKVGGVFSSADHS